ncbi:MAG: hypothetical protein IKL10_06755 [Clostridia bacterium]|nr:hypothetical protein [Clostridia bacterium]
MYNSLSPSYFLGANTPMGFYSLFNELYSPEDGWRLYIIKGGPGTGKSTLMKKIAAECDKRGKFCERIYCSSDPNSLDGVIIPSLKISIADGTSPHVLEPKFPGVSETIVDLGVFRKDKILRENSQEIIRITKDNSFQHKKCIDFLSAAKSVDNDTSSVVLSALKIERLHKFSEKLAAAKLTAGSSSKGTVKKRFLSALTPEGLVLFSDTFTSLCKNTVVLSDSFGSASSVILKVLSIKAAEQGLDSILCYCPMSPEFKPEHLIIPSLSLGFFTSNRWHPEDFEEPYHVDCMRFYDSVTLSKHKNRIAFNKRSRDELITEAVNKLTAAKRLHDELEKYYISAMDFDSMREYSERLISEIFDEC